MVDRGQARAARRQQVVDRDRDAGRGDLGDEVAERLEDPVRVLVGNEPAADLGVRVGRDDRLAALALEAAPDPVDVEGRPGAASLEAS